MISLKNGMLCSRDFNATTSRPEVTIEYPIVMFAMRAFDWANFHSRTPKTRGDRAAQRKETEKHWFLSSWLWRTITPEPSVGLMRLRWFRKALVELFRTAPLSPSCDRNSRSYRDVTTTVNLARFPGFSRREGAFDSCVVLKGALRSQGQGSHTVTTTQVVQKRSKESIISLSCCC